MVIAPYYPKVVGRTIYPPTRNVIQGIFMSSIAHINFHRYASNAAERKKDSNANSTTTVTLDYLVSHVATTQRTQPPRATIDASD